MKHLKAFRIEKGVSQQAVADYLEITRQAYSNYENGHREPDNEVLLKLAEYFGISVDTLLRGTEKTPTPEGEQNASAPDENFVILSRNAKKLSPEKRKQLLDMAKLMFKEEFDD